MAIVDVDAEALTDALRSELIFLPPDGRCFAVRDGGDVALVTLTPSNPTYWWGNCLRFTHPPHDGDHARWTALFETHVRAMQPMSTHTTFTWEGDTTGEIDDFLAAGFDYFETIGLVAERGEPVFAPHAVDRAPVRIADERWAQLLELLVVTREAFHTEAAYRTFAERRIDGWRRLVDAGQGTWFGIVDDDDRLVSALGVFAEARPGRDGRRIGRFQHVVTYPDARRRGYAGALVEHATAHGFDVLGADVLLIVADENDVARRVYENCGYRLASWQRNLEHAPHR